jgi:hypothetical protein
MELDPELQWAPWLLFEEAVRIAPREPGVYVARERPTKQIVYIGMPASVAAKEYEADSASTSLARRPSAARVKQPSTARWPTRRGSTT